MRLETVGEIVRTLRVRKDLDQIDLAKACGWRDASAVSRIETDRITPTRRTLTKLSIALADPLPAEQIYATFLAAVGVLPTKADVARMHQTRPTIERWRAPSYIVDPAWNLWAWNDACDERLGFPANAHGKNVLEMYLQSGSCRQAAGDAWPTVIRGLLGRFRRESARHTQRQWHRALMNKLQAYPEFAAMWVPGAENGIADNALRVPLDDDPRFTIVSVLGDH